PHADRLTSLDQDWGKQGIDGIYQKPDGEYVVIEVKPNDKGTETTGLGKQLSELWLRNHLGKMFPDDPGKINEIIDGAERVLVNYESVRAGDISMQLVDSLGDSSNRRFNP
ncbi:MAG: hypothetical protein AB8B97_10935, partial [Granulosicoccus sp.]